MASSSTPGPSPAKKRFAIDRRLFTRHYDIKAHDGTPLHYVRISAFRRGTPDLEMHAGPTAKSALAAVCHMPHLSGDLKLGLGDPAAPAPDAVRWEDLARQHKANASEYRLAMDVPGEGRRGFVWKRTHSVAVDGRRPAALSERNHKLLDGETGALLAVFSHVRSTSRCGELQLNVDYGQDFETVVLLSSVALYEKARRRASRRSSYGGS